MNGYRFASLRRYVAGAIVATALIAGCSVLTGCSKEKRPSAESSPPPGGVDQLPVAVRIFFRPLPEKMPGGEQDTVELVSLGRKLFFERGISLAKSQACNDCHRLDEQRAGADDLPTSKGAKGIFGKRNAPTVLNAGFQVAQFWDGRAADLAAQAKGPVLNPIEMGLRTEDDVVNLLAGMEGYRSGFGRAFPGQAQPITFDNVALAIAAFERTLITPSRFDRYLRGRLDALSDEEKEGLHRFMDTGCVECHSSVPVGGRLFQKLGVRHPYPNQQDLGRYEVTHREEDRLVFKVPMLRNVTRTAPYFHDGQVSALPEAVRLMAWMQLDKALPPGEIDEIVRFLRTLEAEGPLVLAMP